MIVYHVYSGVQHPMTNAVYSVENIRVSSIMKLTMWYCVKLHSNYLVLLSMSWKVETRQKTNKKTHKNKHTNKQLKKDIFEQNITFPFFCSRIPRLPKGVGYHPLETAKTLVSATKWLQLIVGSSFAVILVEKNDHPTFG